MNRATLNLVLLGLAIVLGSIALWQLRRAPAPTAAAPERSDYSS